MKNLNKFNKLILSYLNMKVVAIMILIKHLAEFNHLRAILLEIFNFDKF